MIPGRILVVSDEPSAGELVRVSRHLRAVPGQRWCPRSSKWLCSRLEHGRTAADWFAWFWQRKEMWINAHDPRYPNPRWRRMRGE